MVRQHRSTYHGGRADPPPAQSPIPSSRQPSPGTGIFLPVDASRLADGFPSVRHEVAGIRVLEPAREPATPPRVPSLPDHRLVERRLAVLAVVRRRGPTTPHPARIPRGQTRTVAVRTRRDGVLRLPVRVRIRHVRVHPEWMAAFTSRPVKPGPGSGPARMLNYVQTDASLSLVVASWGENGPARI